MASRQPQALAIDYTKGQIILKEGDEVHQFTLRGKYLWDRKYERVESKIKWVSPKRAEKLMNNRNDLIRGLGVLFAKEVPIPMMYDKSDFVAYCVAIKMPRCHGYLLGHSNESVRSVVASYSDKYHHILKDDYVVAVRAKVLASSQTYHKDRLRDASLVIKALIAQMSPELISYFEKETDSGFRQFISHLTKPKETTVSLARGVVYLRTVKHLVKNKNTPLPFSPMEGGS